MLGCAGLWLLGLSWAAVGLSSWAAAAGKPGKPLLLSFLFLFYISTFGFVYLNSKLNFVIFAGF
jgi:hypothetical protein